MSQSNQKQTNRENEIWLISISKFQLPYIKRHIHPTHENLKKFDAFFSFPFFLSKM